MPFFPKRRPLYSVLTDAAQGIGLFCRKKLPWLAVTTALPGLPALGIWWQQGGKLPDRVDPEWIVVAAGFATAVVFAALLLAWRDRATEAGVSWTFEERPLCEERAATFVRRLLAGKRRLAFEQVCETMQDRLRFPAFDEEWKTFESPTDAAEVSVVAEERRGPDDANASPFARYCARSLRPLAIVDVTFSVRTSRGSARWVQRFHLAARRDDWVVIGWDPLAR
jgi:hypothetical protein